jgi:hypothetical protein
MAQTKRLCLFSGNLCRECALYRARHHYLCSRDNYRGHLCKTGEVSDTIAPPAPGPSSNHKSEIPYIKPRNVVGMYTIINNER